MDKDRCRITNFTEGAPETSRFYSSFINMIREKHCQMFFLTHRHKKTDFLILVHKVEESPGSLQHQFRLLNYDCSNNRKLKALQGHVIPLHCLKSVLITYFFLLLLYCIQYSIFWNSHIKNTEMQNNCI